MKKIFDFDKLKDRTSVWSTMDATFNFKSVQLNLKDQNKILRF